MPLYLREQDVEKLLPMRQAIPLVEDALRALGQEQADNRPRQRVQLSAGVLHVMMASLPTSGYAGFKAYTASHGKVQFYVHLFDARSGEYLAIMQADRLGQIRTGAASGVATKYLARADAQTAGIIGTGWQAQSQLEAICAVRPIRVARCYSRDPAHRAAFVEKMSPRVGIRIENVDDVRHAAFDSDVICTATSSATPVLSGDWLMPGAHVNAIGANWANRRELDDKAIRRSGMIFVDSLEQAKLESGDLIQAIEKKLLDWSKVRELGALVAGQTMGREDSDDVTLFKSHGIALEDVAVAGWVYEQAHAQNLGDEIPL